MRSPNAVLLAWIVAVAATLGSLFLSEVMRLPPCVLCWYQRIAMYPLVTLLPVGWVFRDSRLIAYASPLSLTGLVVAVYHNLLYYHVIPDSLSPCTQGISCTSQQIEWLGFVTIPLMALVSFVLVNLLLIGPYLVSLMKELRG